MMTKTEEQLEETDYTTLLEEIYQEILPLIGKGKVADYIPELGRVNPNQFGMAICYDLRFPRIFEDYHQQGCQAVCCPSAFTYQTGKDHWMVLLRARAIVNRCYVLAANQWGMDNKGLRHYGHSAIIDPWGNVLASAGSVRNRILYAELDNAVIVRYHQRLPVM